MHGRNSTPNSSKWVPVSFAGGNPTGSGRRGHDGFRRISTTYKAAVGQYHSRPQKAGPASRRLAGTGRSHRPGARSIRSRFESRLVARDIHVLGDAAIGRGGAEKSAFRGPNAAAPRSAPQRWRSWFSAEGSRPAAEIRSTHAIAWWPRITRISIAGVYQPV